MTLISKEVEITICSKNINYYEELGYIIPRKEDKYGRTTTPRGTKIKVNIKDLMDGTGVVVKVKCDNPNCKDPFLLPIRWVDYKKCVRQDGKYYCRKCAKKLYGNEKFRKTKLKNSKSFKQWCLENNRQDVLDKWDYELNKYKPDEVNYSTKKQFYFKCPKGTHKSELKTLIDFTSGNNDIGCKSCNSFAQYLIDSYGKNALDLYWSDLNTLSPWNISKNSANKVFIICQEKIYHNAYPVYCNNFVSHNHRCPYCSNKNGKVHKLDSLGALFPEVLDIWSDKNKKSPYEYAPKSNQFIWFKCTSGKHQEYYKKIEDANQCDFRCPECTRERIESFLQEKVRLYLETFNYTILHEYNCTILPKNPKSKTNNLLPFDNEIKELKLIIEVHGEQHYNIVTWHKQIAERRDTLPEYELHYQKLKDRYKRIFAKSQGYFYLEIPYWTDNKEETWKKLIDDKIKILTI